MPDTKQLWFRHLIFIWCPIRAIIIHSATINNKQRPSPINYGIVRRSIFCLAVLLLHPMTSLALVFRAEGIDCGREVDNPYLYAYNFTLHSATWHYFPSMRVFPTNFSFNTHHTTMQLPNKNTAWRGQEQLVHSRRYHHAYLSLVSQPVHMVVSNSTQHLDDTLSSTLELYMEIQQGGLQNHRCTAYSLYRS